MHACVRGTLAVRARRSMSGSHCTFFPDRLLEREHNRYACEAHQGHVPKIVDIGPEAGLSGKGSSYERVRALQCCNRRGSLREQIALHLLNGVTHRDSPRIQRSHELIAMELFMPRDDGLHNGDPVAAADGAEQIVET